MSARLRLAELADAPSIHHVMTVAGAAAAAPDLYYVDTLEFVEDHIACEGFIVVAEVDSQIVGFQIVRRPGSADDNLGLEIGLSGADLDAVAHVESAAVLPAHRGGGIQRALVTEAERRLVELGYRWLMCTVHPDNVHSLRNLRALGFEVIGTRDKYGGYRRHIMLKTVG